MQGAILEVAECIASGIELDEATRSAFDDYCARKGLEDAARRGAPAYQELFKSLLELLPEPTSASYVNQGATGIMKAVGTLFCLALSQSGTAVKVKPGVAEEEGPLCAVLVLGFGGASMTELEPIERVYEKLRPSWRVVTTTMTRLPGQRAEELGTAQLRETVEALEDADHIYVHSCSNHGYSTWHSLVREVAPELSAKVRGFLYDCGVIVGKAVDEASWFQIFSKSERQRPPSPDAPPRACLRCRSTCVSPPRPPRSSMLSCACASP